MPGGIPRSMLSICNDGRTTEPRADAAMVAGPMTSRNVGKVFDAVGHAYILGRLSVREEDDETLATAHVLACRRPGRRRIVKRVRGLADGIVGTEKGRWELG